MRNVPVKYKYNKPINQVLNKSWVFVRTVEYDQDFCCVTGGSAKSICRLPIYVVETRLILFPNPHNNAMTAMYW